MNPCALFPRLAALAFLPALALHADTIVATDFDGQIISGNEASGLNWTLSGVDDPGSLSASNAGGGSQNLFNGNSLTQSIFIPGVNTGNGNTFWTTGVSLTVAAGSTVTLTDVTFDYWSVNGGQAQNVDRRSDFTVTLIDPSAAVIEAVTVADVLNGTGANPDAGTPVTLTFSTPRDLSAPGTYTLEIKGGDFTGFNETGNHTGIDNLSINGTLGNPADNTAPTPDPMTFAVAPAATGTTTITMTAETASDSSGVEYLFTNTTLATESGWQNSAVWTDTGLTAGTEYTYTVTARDKSPARNATSPSSPASATTSATDISPPTPDPMTFAVFPTPVTASSITMTATTASDETGVEYLFENLTLATDSGWQTSPTWTDTGLAANVTYSYTVTARDTTPARLETAASAPAEVTLVEFIATTNFDGMMVTAGNTASNLKWALNGVEDPGAMSAFNATGGGQVLFGSTVLTRNLFAPGLNTGNGNTFWTTRIPLTVAAGSAVTLTAVTFDCWSINGGQVQNVNRRSDFTVTLLDPSSAVVEAVTVADVLNGTGAGGNSGAGTPVTLSFASPQELTDSGTYVLEIKGGDFAGTDETGNHTGIDNLAILGTAGADTRAEITSLTSLGGGLWELTLTGLADTGYEFRSSAIMDFDPGTLIEDLVPGIPALGVIGGDNDSVVTTDGEGNATVRMMLSGPAQFVRARIPPPPPPLYAWDFEADNGGFTTTGTPNDWAWGTPDSNNDAGLIFNAGNGGSAGCWATNLGDGTSLPTGAIDPAANSILRTPDLDLTGARAAQLTFAAAVDAQTGDAIEVLIRESGTGTQLGSTIAPLTAPVTADWASLGPFDLSAADGKTVYLEFRFQGGDSLYIGLYLDDVVITLP
jgi:hypothetical protein